MMCSKVTLIVSLLMAESSVHSIAYAFPNIQIVTSAIDPEVNDKFFVMPGIGERKENERRPKSRREKKEGTSEKQWKKISSFKTQEKKAPLSSEDEDEEEWIESGDSLDDIVINEVTDQETDDIIFQVEDLKVGDYILALFVTTGKRAVVHYKYVAKVLQV
ncbi:hypothetical protein FQA39_LY02338 [Lamprigera yunnana]|nr:hypothetical protein FQA39_LY02338 [Lamprigera yunnana]